MSKAIEDIGIHEFDLQKIESSCTWIMVGPPASGKTTLIENIAYYNRHKYPVARVFVGTPGAYTKFCEIFGSLYVSAEYNETEEREHIGRQRQCILENGERYVGNYAINIIDDAGDDPKVYKTKTMRSLFKLGSQHYAQLLLVGLQYAIDFPPDTRKSVSYVALFREPEETERKKLYENFGGLAGSYDRFCDLMDALTGDYTCLIFNKRTQSNKLEDCVFYYRTKVLPPWKFGCKEFQEWNKKRINSAYKESSLLGL